MVADWLVGWLNVCFAAPADGGNSRWKALDLSRESCANMMQNLLSLVLALVAPLN